MDTYPCPTDIPSKSEFSELFGEKWAKPAKNSFLQSRSFPNFLRKNELVTTNSKKSKSSENSDFGGKIREKTVKKILKKKLLTTLENCASILPVVATKPLKNKTKTKGENNMNNTTNFRMTKELNALVDNQLSKLSTVNVRHELRAVALEYLELHAIVERAKARMDEIKDGYADAFVECGDTYCDNHTAIIVQSHGAPELLEVVITPETCNVDWKRWAQEVHGTTAEAVKALGFTTPASRRVRIQHMTANGVKTYRKVVAGRILNGNG